MTKNLLIQKIKRVFTDEVYRLTYLDTHGFSRWVSGEKLLRGKYQIGRAHV